MIKTPTIMKQNPLIMAEFEKAFSEVDHDVVNILLNALQNDLKLDDAHMDLFNYEKVLERKVTIKASTFKKFGKFGVNANKNIFNSLRKISNTDAVVRNFRDVDSKFVKAKNMRIINSVRLIDTGSEDSREHEFEVQFNEFFLQMSTKQFNIQVGNYTQIEISTVSEVKGKHAKKLYEMLKSKQYRETSFSIHYEHLQKVFNLQGKDFSYVVRIIKTNFAKVNKIIPFEFEPFKSDKIISFKFK